MASFASRRRFLAAAPAVWLTAAHPLTIDWLGADVVRAATTDDPVVSGTFPQQDWQVVKEIVTVSHFNLERVRELVTARPALAKASWDWGFGDWEASLGAASHTGNQEIAAVLLDHGARPTIFSSAMLGQLDVVQAFVEASPGAQGIPGPHDITLLAHARRGGDAAQEVVEYLESVGGADDGPQHVALSDAERERIFGRYVFGNGDDDYLEVSLNERNGQIRLNRPGKDARRLIHLGSYEFHPLGATAVRVRIAFEDHAAVLTVHDPDLVVTARRAL